LSFPIPCDVDPNPHQPIHPEDWEYEDDEY